MMSVDLWRPADGLSLEPNALRAAKAVHRNLAMTAGPGAGKTEMLAQRADFLLRTGTCRYPRRILAISFKVDASKNLKERVRRRCGPELAARFDSYTFHAFAKIIIDRFRLVLTGADALDEDYSVEPQRTARRSISFDDMVPLATQILESSSIARKAIRQTYSHVFLDEFQDCTNQQYELIKAAFLGTSVKLTAVGDTKQSIMGWAGALEGIFAEYALDFNAIPLNLYQNFRSAPLLRRMQNAMVRVMDPPAALPDAALEGPGGEIEVARYESSAEEAEELANKIQLWIEDEGVEPSEIAILASKMATAYCAELRTALDARDISYRNDDAEQNLAAEPIASLIADFLLVVIGRREPAAYRRITDLVMFSERGGDEAENRARFRWDRLLQEARTQVIEGAVDLADKAATDRLVDEMLVHLGRETLVALSPEYEHGGRLDALIDQVKTRAHELLTVGGNAAQALSRFSGDQAVRIMTIHKSKGLEFDTVVVHAVEAETFFGEEDPERSVFFVGISRAKRRLVLTVAAERSRPNNVRRWSINRNEHSEFIGYAENTI